MKYLHLFEAFTTWYRGHTTNTKENSYVWVTKNRKMAEVYSIINFATYGGDKLVNEFKIDLSKRNILDVSMYDMDEDMDISELEDFLIDIKIDYNVETLFDSMEDEIPLSRLVNIILNDIMIKYEVLKIKESGKMTLCINTNFLVQK